MSKQKKKRTHLSFRLGPLATTLDAHCNATGESHSDVGREALAEKLGVEPPAMPQGFAAMAKSKADRIRKRRKKRGET